MRSKEENRTDQKCQIKNEEGETLKQPDEIMKEYIKYYRALPKTKSITIEQKEAEIKV